MASQSALRKTDKDKDRGIQNVNLVQDRVAALPGRTTVGDHYKGMGWDKAANDEAITEATNDAIIAEAVNDEIAYLTYVAEEDEAEQEMILANRIREEQQVAEKKAIAKKVSKASLASRRRFVGMSLGVAGTAYMFQLPLALLSLVAFYFHAKAIETKETTWYGKVLGVFWDFPSKLPFEMIAMGCWAIILIITIAVFITYLFIFKTLRISVFSSTTAILVTACCFALNIFPVTNILPFLLVWVIYMSFMGESE